MTLYPDSRYMSVVDFDLQGHLIAAKWIDGLAFGIWVLYQAGVAGIATVVQYRISVKVVKIIYHHM